MAFSRPKILAMPSPTEMTVPTSCMSISFSKPFIWVLMSWLISSTFIILNHPFDYFFSHEFELRLKASVQDSVVYPKHKPSEKGWVVPVSQYYFLAGEALELRPYLVYQGAFKLYRSLNRGPEPSCKSVFESGVSFDHLFEEADVPGLNEDGHEPCHIGRKPDRGRDLIDEAFSFLELVHGIEEYLYKAGVPLEHGQDAPQLLAIRLIGLLFHANFDDGLRESLCN